jgi:glycosyltransferase involved in cell wall biosynthesis
VREGDFSGALPMRNLRVLVLTYEYPPIGGGGGRVAREIAQRLSSRGIEFHVLTARWGTLPASENHGNVYVYRVSSGRKYPDRCTIPEMFFYLISSTIFVFRNFKRIRPHLVHVHFAVPSGPTAYLIKKIFRTPYIITLHGGDVPGFLPEETDWAYRIIYPLTVPIWREAERVIAVSESLRDLAKQAYPKIPVYVIPNGVEIKQNIFHQNIRREKVRIVFVGRFSRQKNPMMFLKSIKRLIDFDYKLTNKIEILMIGDGDLRALMENYIIKNGLGNVIRLLGWIKQEEVEEILINSDIYVNTSIIEGFSLSVLQAMAAGMAVIATAVPGNRELIEHQVNGWLVSPDSVHELSFALYCLINDSFTRNILGKNALIKAKYYHWESVCEKYLRVYIEVLGEGIMENASCQEGLARRKY